MTDAQQAELSLERARWLTPRWKGSVADWCESNLRFNEPGNTGPWSCLGREYVREPLDCFGQVEVTDIVMVFGSQTGKTGAIMGGVAWALINDPSRVLWVMPNLDLAQSFSETRWQEMLKASPATKALIPTGRERHKFKKAQQKMGGSIVNFVGSNSPANLASNPARVIVLDEEDKFNMGGKREANAVRLAEDRTKRFANPKRVRTSTPTLVDGLIWQDWLKGDQRRYFMPCVLCGQFVVFVWDANFTVLKLTGAEAFIKWDQGARRGKGDWNLQRVFDTAHAECPHCKGAILDGKKSLMIRQGVWRPTATETASRGYRSYHLSSLYACAPETSFGRLAVKFLQDKRSLLGLQGMVNGDLAEPWQHQDTRSERIELVVADDAPGHGEESIVLLTVDVQVVGVKFWWVARRWWKGDSRLVQYGRCEEWDDLRKVQLDLGVQDNHVIVDSGDQTQLVYEQCLRWGKLVRIPNAVPMHVGWWPAKGREKEAKWTHQKTGQPRMFGCGKAPLSHSRFELPVLEFNGQALKDILLRLRRDKTRWKWELTKAADEEYYRQLDGEVKQARQDKRTGRTAYEWVKRSNAWPNHLLDCEVMQLAGAMFHRRLPWAEQINEPKPNHERTHHQAA